MSDTFYRKQLSSRQARIFYDNMIRQTLGGNLSGRYTLTPNQQASALNDVLAAADAMRRDRPDFFHLGWENRAVLSSRGSLTLTNRVLFTPEQIRRTRPLLAAKLSELTDGLEVLSPWQRELELYTRIVRHIHYEEQAGDDFLDHTAVGPLLRGSGVCEGFSALTSLAMRRVGIPCIRVDGEGHKERHCWNLVWTDAGCFHLDVTWEKSISGHPAYHYFNLSDREISRDHIRIRSSGLPSCCREDGGYHAAFHCLFPSPDEGVHHLLSALHSGEEVIRFKLTVGDVEACIRSALKNAPPGRYRYCFDKLRGSAILYRNQP